MSFLLRSRKTIKGRTAAYVVHAVVTRNLGPHTTADWLEGLTSVLGRYWASSKDAGRRTRSQTTLDVFCTTKERT
jgi:hypothetical protein